MNLASKAFASENPLSALVLSHGVQHDRGKSHGTGKQIAFQDSKKGHENKRADQEHQDGPQKRCLRGRCGCSSA